MIAVLVNSEQAPNLEHVAKARGGEQADAGTLALEQGVEADRRPVQEVARALHRGRVHGGGEHTAHGLVHRSWV